MWRSGEGAVRAMSYSKMPSRGAARASPSNGLSEPPPVVHSVYAHEESSPKGKVAGVEAAISNLGKSGLLKAPGSPSGAGASGASEGKKNAFITFFTHDVKNAFTTNPFQKKVEKKPVTVVQGRKKVAFQVSSKSGGARPWLMTSFLKATQRRWKVDWEKQNYVIASCSRIMKIILFLLRLHTI